MKDLLKLRPQLLAENTRKTNLCHWTILFQQRLPFNLHNAAHTGLVERMIDLVLLDSILDLQFDFLREMVCSGGIALSHNNLDDVLPFEDFAADYRDVYDHDLRGEKNTSYRFTRSTLGLIFSTKSLMNSRNSSCYFLLSCTPMTSPCFYSMPI